MKNYQKNLLIGAWIIGLGVCAAVKIISADTLAFCTTLVLLAGLPKE